MIQALHLCQLLNTGLHYSCVQDTILYAMVKWHAKYFCFTVLQVRESDPRPYFLRELYTAGISTFDTINRELLTVQVILMPPKTHTHANDYPNQIKKSSSVCKNNLRQQLLFDTYDYISSNITTSIRICTSIKLNVLFLIWKAF